MNSSDGVNSPARGILLTPSGDGTAVADRSDPVLASLGQAREAYLKEKDAWDRRQDEAHQAREDQQQTAEELRQARARLTQERQRAERQKQRADRLAAHLKDIHRALIGGNVYELILKACMGITGATRGLYVAAWGDGRFRIRAGVEMGGRPSRPPSPFIEALCRECLAEHKTLLCNRPESFANLPKPSGPEETFRNALVAPAVLVREVSGVVVLADKTAGDFDQEDAEVVLSVGDQAAVAVENTRLQQELADAYFSIVGVLADAVEAKDPYLHGHSEMVARYARRTADRMKLTDAERGVACYGGLLHDIGKIGVSDGVLHKTGKLMPEEWTLMKSHVRVGRDLLAWVPVLGAVADVVHHHHEHFDGTGYPDGLSAESIPLAARIVAVVDAYCAMVVKRTYKEAMTDAEARAELTRCKGTHFDPAVVDAFLAVLDDPEPEEEPGGFGVAPEGSHLDDFRRLLQAAPARAAAVAGKAAHDGN